MPPGPLCKMEASGRVLARKGPRGLRPVTVARRAATADVSTAGVAGRQPHAACTRPAVQRPHLSPELTPHVLLHSCCDGRDALPGCGSRAQSRLNLGRTLSRAQTRVVAVRLTFAPAGFRRVPKPLASSPACFVMLCRPSYPGSSLECFGLNVRQQHSRVPLMRTPMSTRAPHRLTPHRDLSRTDPVPLAVPTACGSQLGAGAVITSPVHLSCWLLSPFLGV